MASWTNRAVYQLPRNGTTTHTVDPTSGVNLALGAPFTPTAGRLLLVIAGGAVTSSTPSGWTLPAGGSALNGTGLYVWYRTAVAGANSFTTTHNGSNYPTIVGVYEFPAGSTFVKSVSAVNVAWNGANPAVSGLTGTNLVMAAKQRATTAASPADYTWAGPTVKDWMYYVYKGASTDGYETTLGYVEGYTGASWQPTATHSEENANTFEALTWAISVASAGGSFPASGAAPAVSSVAGAVNARRATSGAVNGTPTVSGTVTARTPVEGVANGDSTVTGDVGAMRPATGATGSASDVTGSVTAARPVTGQVASAGVVSGALTAPGGLSGSVASSSTASGDVTVRHPAAGAIPAATSVAGAMEPAGGIAGTVTAVSGLAGAVVSRFAVGGTVAGASTARGGVGAILAVKGQIACSSTVTGWMRTGDTPVFPDILTLTGTVEPYTLTGSAPILTLEVA
jgi:hypothetical protein